MKSFFFLLLLLFTAAIIRAQSFRIYGKVTDNKLQPLAFVSIQLKENQTGTMTKEDGGYEMNLEVGQYNLVISMIGYKTQVVNLVLNKNYQQNIILEEDDTKTLDDVVIKIKVKDRAEEIIRNVIRNKDSLVSGPYSCSLYIKAIQQDSVSHKKGKSKTDSAIFQNSNADLQGMSMAEVSLHLDYESNQRLKEKRLGIKKTGNSENLFYLSATDGDFSFYNNLIKIPSISSTPFLSPISYSGLLAYKFKTIKIERKDGHKTYTISVKPRQLSNATVEGEITIDDSTWAILHTRFSFPSYHLPEYDFFEVDQQYAFVQNKEWMMTRQLFNYYSKAGKHKLSGQTLIIYTDYELDKKFGKNYFGVEVSATTQTAYEKDSAFWATVRTEPLTDKEIRFIRFKDSIFRATHTQLYLDSIDHITNKITWKKLGLFGQTFYNRLKERTWVVPPLVALYEPFQFGGARIHPSFYYYKRYESRKDITLLTELSYGLRNKDINGSIQLRRMYNPFNRGYYQISLNRDFYHIYEGDAWINQIQRSSYFLNNFLGVEHGLEVTNGLYLFTEADYALRRSVVGYKTNPKLDSLLVGVITTNNQPVGFDPFNAMYTKITLKYTPKQHYLREPKEKIILGSKWPTFYATWRKGIPNIFGSHVNFDYMEYGIEQTVQIGILGNLRYNIKTGSFLNTKDLKLLDYQYMRRGDPFLFMNPDEAFQGLDSTFPVFKRFYQAHAVHEFNGALINKIPLLKKLQLREIIGCGFLYAPERNLKYAELFGGVERVFKWPFNPLTKFKLGFYVVGSVANKFSNPIQFKLGFTTWDKKRNKWH